jgi:hypothetical protein
MALVLQLPAFNREFVVECDVSGSSFGASLHQGSGSVTYNKQIAPRYAKLGMHERELIGLVQAVRHCRPYLWEHSFLIRTDQFSLKFLLDQHLSTIPKHQASQVQFPHRVQARSH